MDETQKFVSSLLDYLQGRLENTENGLQKLILKRLIAIVEEYIVETN